MKKLMLGISTVAWILSPLMVSSVWAYPSAQTCPSGNYFVSEKVWPRFKADGTSGKNIVINVDTDSINYDSWINIDSAFADANNWVEVGWRSWRTPDNVEHWEIFGAKTENGTYALIFTRAGVSGHNYQFQVRQVSSSSWKFRVVDLTTGSVIRDQNYSITKVPEGYPQAQQERKNICLHGETHWWNLQYWDGSSWVAWPNMALDQDNDPQYDAIKISATEFWVKKVV